MTSAEEARRWLASAEDELKFARYSARGGYSAHACFAAQQAAEKAVKAVHYAAGARMVLGSSVRSLIDRLDPPVPALRAATEDARTLDLYYVPTRYPNGLPEGTPAEAFSAAQAAGALECAARVVAVAGEHVRARASDLGPASDSPGSDAPARDVPAGDAPARDVPAGDAPENDAPANHAPTGEAAE